MREPDLRVREDVPEPHGLVLLVDDEPLFLRALVRMLRPERHRLLTAQNLDEARAALADPASKSCCSTCSSAAKAEWIFSKR